MSDKVGYRRPPASGQFKKGTSGNPKGRPKGSRNFVNLLEDELAQPIVVNENGKKARLPRIQVVVKRLVTGALQGDPKALITMIDIMRRTGQLDAKDDQSLLPDNYESVLDSYVQSRKPAKPRGR